MVLVIFGGENFDGLDLGAAALSVVAVAAGIGLLLSPDPARL